MIFRVYFLSFFSALLICNSAIAVSPVLRLNAAESDSNLSVGAHIRLEILISKEETAPESPAWTIEFKSPRRWLTHGPLLLDAYSIGDSEDRKDKIRIDAVILDAGELIVPPFEIRKEGERETIETNSLEMKTISNFDNAEQVKQDKPAWLIAPQEHGGFNSIVLGILSALGVGLLIWLLFFLRRKFLKSFNRDQKSAKDIADQELQNLRAWVRDSSEDPGFEKTFSYDCTKILRKYLSRRLDLPLLESTDSELMDALSKRAFSSNLSNKCHQILNATFTHRYYKAGALRREDASRIVTTLSEVISEVEQDFETPTQKIKKEGNK